MEIEKKKKIGEKSTTFDERFERMDMHTESRIMEIREQGVESCVLPVVPYVLLR